MQYTTYLNITNYLANVKPETLLAPFSFKTIAANLIVVPVV
nr:hypothetical protein [Apilactobacillus ozensis]